MFVIISYLFATAPFVAFFASLSAILSVSVLQEGSQPFPAVPLIAASVLQEGSQPFPAVPLIAASSVSSEAQASPPFLACLNCFFFVFLVSVLQEGSQPFPAVPLIAASVLQEGSQPFPAVPLIAASSVSSEAQASPPFLACLNCFFFVFTEQPSASHPAFFFLSNQSSSFFSFI